MAARSFKGTGVPRSNEASGEPRLARDCDRHGAETGGGRAKLVPDDTFQQRVDAELGCLHSFLDKKYHITKVLFCQDFSPS